MKKFILIVIAALFSIPSFAHIDMGMVKGKTAAGAACGFMSLGTYHVGGMGHPLNERVEITVDGIAVQLRHPPVLDERLGSVRFNHDRFEGFTGIAGGGVAVIVEMAHPPGAEGYPSKLTVIQENWKDATKNTRMDCALDRKP